MSIDEQINDEGRELTLKDIIKSDKDYDNVEYITLKYGVESLEEPQRQIIKERYFLEVKMTIKYDDIYINESAVVAGEIEKNGPLVKYFDKVYDDYYIGEDTFEQAEMKMVVDSVDILLNKCNKTKNSNIYIYRCRNCSFIK